MVAFQSARLVRSMPRKIGLSTTLFTSTHSVPGLPKTCLYNSLLAAVMRQFRSRTMTRVAGVARSNRDA